MEWTTSQNHFTGKTAYQGWCRWILNWILSQASEQLCRMQSQLQASTGCWKWSFQQKQNSAEVLPLTAFDQTLLLEKLRHVASCNPKHMCSNTYHYHIRQHYANISQVLCSFSLFNLVCLPKIFWLQTWKNQAFEPNVNMLHLFWISVCRWHDDRWR